MTVIEQAKKHFKDKEVREIAVPEWGDEGGPLVIYADPVTLAEKNRVKKRIDRDGLEGLAFALVLKAKTADGEKMFTIKDLHDLAHKVDPDVLTRIASDLMGIDDGGEEAEKK